MSAGTDARTFGTCRILQLQAANGIEQQTESDEDLEKKMEEFLKTQAEKESGRLLRSDQAFMACTTGTQLLQE